MSDSRVRLCEIDGCGKQHLARGWCRNHYYRWRRTGRLDTYRRNPDRQLWDNVDNSAGGHGCWPWLSTRTVQNYGVLKLLGKQQSAHRVAYEAVIGPIPSGMQVDHICHNPVTCPGGPACPHRSCCNPAHLKAVTPAENTLRSNAIQAVNKRKTQCKRGHPFDDENTYWFRSGTNRGWCRSCRECSRQKTRAWRASHEQHR